MNPFRIFSLLVLLSLYGGHVRAQSFEEITDRIIYTVRFDGKKSKVGDYYEFLDDSSKTKAINQLCDLIRDGKLQASYYWGDQVGNMVQPFNKLRHALAEGRFSWNDSIQYKCEKGKNALRDNQVHRNLINSLSFLESWHYDEKTNVFKKVVNGVILFQDKYTHNIGMTCNYYTSLNDSTINSFQEKFSLGRIIYDVPVTKTQENECNDYNWWHNYLEPSKRERFFGALKFDALRDTVTPLPAFWGEFPFDSLIERTEYVNTGLATLFYGRSNWYSSDPLLSGMTDNKIQAHSYELSDWTTIKKLRFDEEWFFDPENLRFEKKVLGLGVIVDTFNEDGDVIGEKCLLYYKLNP
ncbi:MAG: hypothetical protein GC178_00895 [Flavobacteriales bacterium]|nr:hypothetical protein [Flavobacteriales bacterium]